MKNLIDRLNDFIENRKKEISEEKKKREISTLLRNLYSSERCLFYNAGRKLRHYYKFYVCES